MLKSRFNRWVAEKYHTRERHGLKISGYSFRDGVSDEAIDFVVEAIDLLSDNDSKRFARFREYFDYIIIGENSRITAMLSGGILLVDVNRMNFSTHRDWYLCILSGYFVFHSASALIKSRGVEYQTENAEELESMCFKEQMRFLESLPKWQREGWTLEFRPSSLEERSVLSESKRFFTRLAGHNKSE